MIPGPLQDLVSAPPLEWVPTVTLIFLLMWHSWDIYSPVGSMADLAGKCTTVLAGAGLLTPSLDASPSLWLAISLAHFAWIAAAYHTADNHQYLIGYWCVSLFVSLAHDDRGSAVLAKNGTLLIGLCFACAAGAKLVSRSYRDASMFVYLMLTDTRFMAMGELLCGVTAQDPQRHRAAAGRVRAGESLQEAAPVSSRLRLVAIVLTWWTIGIEILVAVLFLLPISGIGGIRLGTLGVFVVTTYLFVSVPGFGQILLLMAMPTAASGDARAVMLLAAIALTPASFLPQLLMRLALGRQRLILSQTAPMRPSRRIRRGRDSARMAPRPERTEDAAMSTARFTGVSLDLLHTIRSLRRQPVFAATVVMSLALGIGTITAVVTFAEVTLLRPLPVDAPDQLVQLDWQTRRWFPDMQRFVGTGVIAPVPTSPTFPGAAFEPLRTAAQGTADVFAFSQPAAISATVHGTARDARLQMVSGTYFSALRLRPAVGRLLGPSDDQASAPPAAVIGHRFWKARLGADPNVVGTPLVLDGVRFTIAGIAPPEFRGTVITAPAPPDIWIPVNFSARFPWIRDAGSLWWLSLMARVGEGASVEQLTERLQHPMHAAVSEVAKAQADDLPVVRVRPGRRGVIDDTFDDTLEYAMTLSAIFTALLAVVCLNVANLLFARGIARREELAVRLALGADRMRLVRSLVSEGVLLAIVGGIVGLFVATWGVQLLAASTLLPAVADASPNVATLAATTLVTLGVGLVISLFPAIKATARRHDMRLERCR